MVRVIRGGAGCIDMGVAMGHDTPYNPVDKEADHEFCRD